MNLFMVLMTNTNKNKNTAIVLLQILRKKNAKKNVPCKGLSIIILDSIIKAKKKYYKLLLLTLWSLFMDGVQLLQG